MKNADLGEWIADDDRNAELHEAWAAQDRKSGHTQRAEYHERQAKEFRERAACYRAQAGGEA